MYDDHTFNYDNVTYSYIDNADGIPTAHEYGFYVERRLMVWRHHHLCKTLPTAVFPTLVNESTVVSLEASGLCVSSVMDAADGINSKMSIAGVLDEMCRPSHPLGRTRFQMTSVRFGVFVVDADPVYGMCII